MKYKNKKIIRESAEKNYVKVRVGKMKTKTYFVIFSNAC